MSWQSDLRRYVELEKELRALELQEPKDCSCDYHTFHRCTLHDQIAEKCVEQLRLMELWGRVWVLKLYRIAQGVEPVTPVEFKKEAANVQS